MKPTPFIYRRVGDVEDALEWLAELGDDVKLLAGGQSLVPMMGFRLARPAALIDISRLDSCRYAERTGDVLRIGALTTHRELEQLPDEVTAGGFDVIRRAAKLVGHPPIRVRGTFGGSIAHADPSAEWCVLALLLDADVVLRGPAGERVVPAESFFLGFLTTAIEPGEMLVEVRLRRVGRDAVLHEFARRHGDFATVAVAVALDGDASRVTTARIVVGGAQDVPVRIRLAEEALEQRSLDRTSIDDAAAACAAQLDPVGDAHASAQHRRELAEVLARRALEEVSARWASAA